MSRSSGGSLRQSTWVTLVVLPHMLWSSDYRITVILLPPLKSSLYSLGSGVRGSSIIQGINLNESIVLGRAVDSLYTLWHYLMIKYIDILNAYLGLV
ncbi:hypothetical protein EDD16DRAFT_1611015 [Pisolithus croceorrhizus]|nr:hypothetical protein EDD16DRAFT_1611015 [Pisolithus croceorrhizus]